MSGLRVAIVGGTGYGGMELLRWLLGHPEATVTAITSRTETGAVGDVHPHLRGLTDLRFIYAEGLAMGPEAAAKGIASAEREILEAVA